MKFGNGEMGAANGMAADGSIIRANEQAQEVWVGTTLGFAGLLAERRPEGRGLQTAWGLYHVDLRDQGLLVPNSRSMGHHRQLSCQHVHASRRNLGYGDDPQVAFLGICSFESKIFTHWLTVAMRHIG